MGVFDGFARRRQVTAAFDATLAGGIEAGLEVATAASRTLGPKVWAGFIERLEEAQRLDDAFEALERFVGLHPTATEVVEVLLRVNVSLELEQVVELYSTVLAEQAHEGLALQLAQAHFDLGDVARAHEVLELYRKSPNPVLQVKRGIALLALKRPEEALPLLHGANDYYERASRDAFTGGGADPNDMAEARDALEEAIGRTEGAEAVVHELGRRKQLDPGSGRNLQLLAGAYKVEGPRIAPTLVLTSLTTTRAEAERLIASESSRAAGLCARGLAHLREQELDAAKTDFEACLALQPDHFGARAGVGAAVTARQESWHARVLKLPELPAPEGIARVATDWEALSPLERRVVCASVAPLAPLLGRLIETKRHIRLLPIDVRVTDLPELAEVRGVRAEDDHRSFAALGGIAGEELALAGIDGLLDVTAEGWTFAHELSHLCELVLDDAQAEQLDRLYRKALRVPYAFGDYALSNRHEFFAVHYTEYLCRKYGIETHRAPKSSKPYEDVLKLYDTLLVR
ncbi:MAG: hypothetical protein JNK82_13680 [Myxococcaceae bacterium]|nr:hypothetical protein [Myxococcaceae bacterium]